MTVEVSEDLVIPRRPDGRKYPLALVMDDRIICADTHTELLGEIISGYADIDADHAGDREAFAARLEFAALVATNTQAALIASATDGGLDLNGLDEDTLTALFSARGASSAPPTGLWTGPVPLVVLTTDYAPYTSVERPDGDVVFIDPNDERALLFSLDDLGYLDLRVDPDQ